MWLGWKESGSEMATDSLIHSQWDREGDRQLSYKRNVAPAVSVWSNMTQESHHQDPLWSTWVTSFCGLSSLGSSLASASHCRLIRAIFGWRSLLGSLVNPFKEKTGTQPILLVFCQLVFCQLVFYENYNIKTVYQSSWKGITTDFTTPLVNPC